MATLPPIDPAAVLAKQADCAASQAKAALGAAGGAVKQQLLAASSSGFFTSGANLATTLKSNLNTLAEKAQAGVGAVTKEARSLRTDLQNFLQTWVTKGANTAAQTLDDIEQAFPSFDSTAFLNKLQSNTFSLCTGVKDQVIPEGSTAPQDAPDPVPPPGADATATLPDPTAVPSIRGTGFSSIFSNNDQAELAKLRNNADIFRTK